MNLITIHDHGGYEKEKQALEQHPLLINQDLIIHLDKKGHSIQFGNQSMQLNYGLKEYQGLLDSPHPLLTAVGKTRGTLLDACGGLGKDSFILAHHYFDVTTCEINLLIYILLSQAVDQYTQQCPLKWQTTHQQAQNLMTPNCYDIVYLDPMFQEKRSAKPKQGMQLLQIAADKTPFQDWELAWKSAKKRLVIKQHAKSSIITALPSPSHQVKGKRNIRYDVYVKP